VRKTSKEEQEVANLPDFIKDVSRGNKPSTSELLAQIKRDELQRVNQKFGKANPTAPDLEEHLTPSKAVRENEDTLQKTTNLLDEAELALIGGAG
jgi:hypothetical protein